MSSITDVKEDEHDKEEDGDESDDSDEEEVEEVESEAEADISLQSVQKRIATTVVSSPPSTVVNSYISPNVESVESSQAEPVEDYNLTYFHHLVELIEKLFPNIDDNFILTLRRDGNILDFECDGETKSITLI